MSQKHPPPPPPTLQAEIAIAGMHCASCELLLERKFRAIPGILAATVNFRTGKALLTAAAENPPLQETIASIIHEAGYSLIDETTPTIASTAPDQKKWMEIGASLLVIFALHKILQAFDIVAIASATSSAATLGGTLLIGLVAGTSSCLAVTGGLLLSVAAKYNETHQTQSTWEKFQPLLHFNVGRLASYFFLGGLVGLIGRSITLTPRMTGYMNIFVALIMLYLALTILNIIPKGSCPIRPPKWLSHRIASLAESKNPLAPAALGALTFFLPCGFTQSLQLVALASGSFITGALTMFTFALGTLPALLSIGIISSSASGNFSRLFLRFAGTLVFILALWNLNSGLLLTGVDAANLLPSFQSDVTYAGNDPNVTQTSDGQQVINMKVSPYGYEPRSFTIQAGQPTWVYATADSNIGGCTSVLTAPALGLSKFLRAGSLNKLGPFTPTRDFTLTCSMGMVRAHVSVRGTGQGSAPLAATVVGSAGANALVPANAQIVNLTWTAYGYSPSVLEVRAGNPTAVNVSATSPAGGCMSTVVFPNFDQSAFVPAPGAAPATVLLATDRAQPGDYPITCGMGSKMAILRVL